MIVQLTQGSTLPDADLITPDLAAVRDRIVQSDTGLRLCTQEGRGMQRSRWRTLGRAVNRTLDPLAGLADKVRVPEWVATSLGIGLTSGLGGLAFWAITESTRAGSWGGVAVAGLVLSALALRAVYALERERESSLLITPAKLDTFSLKQEGVALTISSPGLDSVVDCTVHVLELLWEIGGIYRNGELQEPDWKAMFANEDIYLHFHNKNAAQAAYTFKGSAVALVAWRDTSALGRHFRLGSVGGKTYLLPSGNCVLAVEIGARNTARQRCAFKMYVPGGSNEEITLGEIDWDQKPVATF